VAVWLTPAADRPWISGTSDNSIWSLIWGYNGLGRLDGQAGGPGGTGGPGGNGASTFGGSAGPLRLLNDALGGQAGWLLGFAIVSIGAVAFVSRMKRDDRRVPWLVATGGAFVVTAIAFSFAQGIFHPYYVSLLAPFSAALVGAGAGLILQGARGARVFGPLAVLAGAGTEIAVLSVNPGQLDWLKPVLVLVAVTAAAVLANPGTARWRSAAIATGLAVLMLAPGAWAFDTLGHATSSTFPAGGPAGTSFGGGPGGGPGGGRFGGMQPPANGSGTGAPTAPPSFGAAPGSSGSASGSSGGASGSSGGASGAGAFGGRGGGFAGGGFGGNSSAVTAAVAYAKSHGGGAVAVSSQSGASSSIINSGADVVAIGGFSGRESQVTTKWFAQEVAAGRIRWVVADSGSGMRNDSRTGSTDVMAAVAKTCKAVTTSAGTIYDCQGSASALAQLG
jgi:hypothetical protein